MPLTIDRKNAISLMYEFIILYHMIKRSYRLADIYQVLYYSTNSTSYRPVYIYTSICRNDRILIHRNGHDRGI